MFRWCRTESAPKSNCLGALKHLIGRRNVKIELRDGLMFIDEVIGVEDGGAVAVFQGRRVAVGDIQTVELA